MIESLIEKVAQLPGLGEKSAKRIVLHLLLNKRGLMRSIIGAMSDALESVRRCSDCGNLDLKSPCSICIDSSRDKSVMCLVKGVSDLWAFEKLGTYKGLYHVLGNDVLSSSSKLEQLSNRFDACDGSVKEVVLAVGATLEDQITTHYLQKIFSRKGVLVTTLACGIPLGAEIDYIDEGTLTIAMQSRKKL